MANEAIFKYGTTLTLANANGGATTNNQMSAAAGTTYSNTNTLDYPDAVFVFTGAATAFGATPTANSTLDLYIRPLDVDGTSDTPAPTATSTYKGQYIGSFVVSGLTASTETYRCVGYDIPRAGEAYIFNNATGQTLQTGWTLKMTPRTVGPL